MDKVLPSIKGYNDFTAHDNKNGIPMAFVADTKGVRSTFAISRAYGGWQTEKYLAAHTGAVDTVLHTTMGRAAIFGLKKAAQIKSSTVEYLGLVPTDEKLSAQARVIGGRGDGEAVIEGRILSADGKLLAKATSTWNLFSVDQLRAGAGSCPPGLLAAFEAVVNPA